MRRYAIYFMPKETDDLWRFGSSVLQYDAVSRQAVDPPAHPLFAGGDFQALTREPRRYGFHATLKAPFELAVGVSEGDLQQAAADFAVRQKCFSIGPLDVANLGSFIALVPRIKSAALHALADACVISFDRFRAPLTAEDRERRQPSRLTPRQVDHLDRWGYPHVFEDFRFHMTLTGSVPDSHRAKLRQALDDLYTPIAAPLGIDGIAVFQQNDGGECFEVLRRFDFGNGN
jgi:putative phosphonate metabolism protein